MPDPISLQVFHNLFSSVAEEMGVALPPGPASAPYWPTTTSYTLFEAEVTGVMLRQTHMTARSAGKAAPGARGVKRNVKRLLGA